MDRPWISWNIDKEIIELLDSAPRVILPATRQEILTLATGGGQDAFTVRYKLPDGRVVDEAEVVKCKNGLAINYVDPEMRRRDPDCLIIGDDSDTDKQRFEDIYNENFSVLRGKTFEWLKTQPLVVAGIQLGGGQTGLKGLVIAPENAGFFVGGICDLQGMLSPAELDGAFEPSSILYLAPVFRHTYFSGKQAVVHNRQKTVHEIFAYNLYPGPSAKKGVYGVLLQRGEEGDWLTLHASTVQVVTPYENITTILHEGASGSGKSEMLEQPHREEDGRLILGENVISGKRYNIALNQTCELHPVTDDMALVDAVRSAREKKLVVSDAEDAWFLRVNHITEYGTDPHLEKLCIHPREPLLFLNIQGAPKSTALIWEHVEDEPGKPCPNPRVILPRRSIPDVVNNAVEVDFRSFGLRAPACTRDNPSYGIVGFFHILPPSLAWLWRLVAPRGHANPSIIDKGGLASEGVGSYWPFATGKYVNHANLLLRQIMATQQTRYILFPNQHVGSWKVGFMPQWVSREYFARRGAARFRPDQLNPSRSPLLGYVPVRMVVEGSQVPDYFFNVDRQTEVGEEAYDKGAEQLHAFFRQTLQDYLTPELDGIGKQIITCCLDKGSIDEMNALIPMVL